MFAGIEIDALFIIAQIVGFVATGVAIYSFQAKRRITILTMQTVSNLLWMVHYIMLGINSDLNYLSAVYANFIGTVRNIIYGFRGKYKFADSKLVPAFSILALLISAVFTFETPFDILPMIGMTLASIAFFIKEEKIIRYISVFIAISWLTYGIYAGSIAGMVSDGCALVSVVIAIFRFRNVGLRTRAWRYMDERTDEEYESDIEEKLSEDVIETIL